MLLHPCHCHRTVVAALQPPCRCWSTSECGPLCHCSVVAPVLLLPYCCRCVRAAAPLFPFRCCRVVADAMLLLLPLRCCRHSKGALSISDCRSCVCAAAVLLLLCSLVPLSTCCLVPLFLIVSCHHCLQPRSAMLCSLRHHVITSTSCDFMPPLPMASHYYFHRLWSRAATAYSLSL